MLTKGPIPDTWFPYMRIIEFIAVLLAIGAFYLDFLDRADDRVIRAWTVIAQSPVSGGNIGQRLALEFLVDAGEDTNGINMDDAWLVNAAISGGNFHYATFLRANLQGADLAGSALYKANFTYADLSSADLSRANMRATILSETNNHW